MTIPTAVVQRARVAHRGGVEFVMFESPMYEEDLEALIRSLNFLGIYVAEDPRCELTSTQGLILSLMPLTRAKIKEMIDTDMV